MEATYFILGMLSIIGVIVITTIVWGVVKIIKLSKIIKSHDTELGHMNRQLWENIQDLREDFERRMLDMDRHADKYTTSLQHELDTRFKDVFDEIGHTRSYVDSRIDKVTGTIGAKQVIKG